MLPELAASRIVLPISNFAVPEFAASLRMPLANKPAELPLNVQLKIINVPLPDCSPSFQMVPTKPMARLPSSVLLISVSAALPAAPLFMIAAASLTPLLLGVLLITVIVALPEPWPAFYRAPPPPLVTELPAKTQLLIVSVE